MGPLLTAALLPMATWKAVLTQLCVERLLASPARRSTGSREKK